MKRTQAFFVSFTITFCIMIMSFMAVYWFAGWSSDKAAGKSQQGVPILSLTPEDTKTALLVTLDAILTNVVVAWAQQTVYHLCLTKKV